MRAHSVQTPTVRGHESPKAIAVAGAVTDESI